MSFNGNSNLYSDNFTELTTDNYTILVVTQLDNSTGGDQALLSMTNVSANAGLGITKTSWGGHRWIVLHRMPKGNSDGNTRYGFNSDTQPHLLMVERKANGSSTDDLNLFLDNESNSSVNNDLTSILNMSNFEWSLKYLSFGSIYYSSLSRPFDGGISEILIYTKALATQEMAEVKYYLSQKWGLTSSVDSDVDGTVDANDADPLN